MNDQDHEERVARLATWIFGLTLGGVVAYVGVVFAWILF